MRKIKRIALRVYSKLFNWDKKQVILIISSGRTGTNFMAYWFSTLSDEFYSVHEPSPDLFQLGIEKYRNKKVITPNLLKIKRSLQLYKLNKDRKEIYIESNPNLLLLLPELNKLFKNLKIIFIKREFEPYVLSAINKSPDNSSINYFYGESDPRKRVTPLDFDDNGYNDIWKNFSREEKIAWWWKKSNEIIDNYHLDNNNSVIIKYEELFNKDNEIVLYEILDFIGLKNIKLSVHDLAQFNVKKNENKIKIINQFNELDDNLKARLYSMIN